MPTPPTAFSVFVAERIAATEKPAWRISVDAGLSPSAISHYTTGRRLPRWDHLPHLAAALGVSVDDLAAAAVRSLATSTA